MRTDGLVHRRSGNRRDHRGRVGADGRVDMRGYSACRAIGILTQG